MPWGRKILEDDLLFSLASEVGQELERAFLQPWNPFPWITSRAYVVTLSPCWESPSFSSFLRHRPWVTSVMSFHPSPQQFPFGQMGVVLLLGMLGKKKTQHIIGGKKSDNWIKAITVQKTDRNKIPPCVQAPGSFSPGMYCVGLCWWVIGLADFQLHFGSPVPLVVAAHWEEEIARNRLNLLCIVMYYPYTRQGRNRPY